jgi:hypothetical protein
MVMERLKLGKKKKNVNHNPKTQHSDKEDIDVSSSDDDTVIKSKDIGSFSPNGSDKPSLECREVNCTLYQKSISGTVPGQKCKGTISGKTCRSVLMEQSLIEKGLRWFKNLVR